MLLKSPLSQMHCHLLVLSQGGYKWQLLLYLADYHKRCSFDPLQSILSEQLSADI